jgi:hypothetical protein
VGDHLNLTIGNLWTFLTLTPSKSLRKLAQEEDIGHATAHNVVREKLQLFPYKVTAVQEFKPADHKKRIRYCEWFTNFIQTKTVDILDVTFFTDEAWFHLSCYVNTRLWSSENPHAVRGKPLFDQKLGVWVAISRRRIVSPLFLEETVNSKRYFSMLYDFIDLLEEDEIAYSWCLQVGATAHTINNSMKLLNEIFGECVICRNLWPLTQRILLRQTCICEEQQNLQRIVIAHARLMS